MHRITMLGTGLIGLFYTQALHSQRRCDRVEMVYSRSAARAQEFAAKWDIPRWSTDMAQAIQDAETDTVIIGIPNHLHLDAARLAAQAGKAVLCTKPLARTAAEAQAILDIVEQHGVFGGYLEDLVYTPKTLKAVQAIQNGALGQVLWARSRETHPGPHSDWFWDAAQSGGGAIIDLACHCIEISRAMIGKENRPLEVMCWGDTQVHPIQAEDSAIGLVRYANGAIGQFEVSWAFRGGMDLRDEVSGTQGTIWLNHFLRTGFEMFTAAGRGGYVAEKAEGEMGWVFPVGDEVHELGYHHMFTDMFEAMDRGTPPQETLYDGYVVNAIMDACYRSIRSRQWETVDLIWRGPEQVAQPIGPTSFNEQYWLIKEEKMPDGALKIILKDKVSGDIIQQIQK